MEELGIKVSKTNQNCYNAAHFLVWGRQIMYKETKVIGDNCSIG